MEAELDQLATLFPNIAAQMRAALSNLHLASTLLAPAEARERDPALDQRAALVDQSYYRLLRLTNNLSAAAFLGLQDPLPLGNQDIVELLHGIFERSESLGRPLGLEMRLICPVEQHICAVQRPALEQLLYQLLSNAFKYTSAGGTVTLELKLAGGRVLLSVADTGCGIAPDQLETLFDRYRSGEPAALPAQGLGLGLPLCRGIAEGLGGAILAESTPGKGTRFTLSLPDRQVDHGVSDVGVSYTGGFNPTLLALSDALPPESFLLRSQN